MYFPECVYDIFQSTLFAMIPVTVAVKPYVAAVIAESGLGATTVTRVAPEEITKDESLTPSMILLKSDFLGIVKIADLPKINSKNSNRSYFAKLLERELTAIQKKTPQAFIVCFVFTCRLINGY